jgi:peptide/nickel transport system ATP-binding protein
MAWSASRAQARPWWARQCWECSPANIRIESGRIAFAGRDITHIRERERRQLLGRDIALIPQNPMTSLNPVFRIEQQFTDVLRLHLDLNGKQARERALALLHDVHIRKPERVLQQYPHELSGGMRQRILTAVAFAFRPKLIIADEPTTALDVTVQRQILRLIKELQENAGTAVLFISHNLAVVAKICDWVSVIHSGLILESADVASLFRSPWHAYTRALLAATPRYDRPGEELRPIPPELTRRLREEAKRLR